MASHGFAVPFLSPGPVLNLLQAAFDGDIPLLKSLVMKLDKGGGSPKEAIEAMRVEDAGELEGLGALHIAACRGRLEVCRYLVGELRVDVDGVDKKGMWPMWLLPSIFLIMVLIWAKPVMMSFLLYIMLLDQPNKLVNGRTPMFAAIHAASRECMVLLFKAGADTMEALTYATENLHSANLMSTDCRNSLMEDVATNDGVLDDNEPMFKKEIRGAALKKLGTFYFKIKDYCSAVKGYTKATQLNLGDATLFSNRSLCWLLMGEGGKALVDANQCRTMRPDWPKACYRQGAALMLLKDYEGASERFTDGLKLDPGNAEMEHALREAMECLTASGINKSK